MADDGAKSKLTSHFPEEIAQDDFQSTDSKKSEKEDDFSDWFKAVVGYVKETQTNVLDLSYKELKKEEVKVILNFLSDSTVTELNLQSNCLTNGMSCIAPLLIKTKIKKLNVTYAELTKEDTLHLAEVLKDSQITDLKHVSIWRDLIQFNFDQAHTFLSHLQTSKVTCLTPNFCFKHCKTKFSSLFQKFLSTSVTCLDIDHHRLKSNDLIFLFKNLSHSSVTDFRLTDNKISREALQELSQRLVETKIEKLDLGTMDLKDDELNVLSKGLVNSKVTNLNLGGNHFSSLSPLFAKLKETQIKTLSLRCNSYFQSENLFHPDCFRHTSLASLDLSHCYLSDKTGEELLESLKFSNVSKLELSVKTFASLTLKKLAENIKDVNLTELHIPGPDPASVDEFFMFAKCLKDSKLKRLIVDQHSRGLVADHLISFLKLTEGSSISEIKMDDHGRKIGQPSVFSHPILEPKKLANTTFTELDLKRNLFGNQVSVLVTYLKFTAITYLNLSSNDITDNDVAAISECLKETQIRRLNLDFNSITSQGAKALALSLKDSNILYLHLSYNRIEDNGFEFLTEHAKDTFISELHVSANPGKRILMVDKVLWQNKIAVHKLVSIFKQIAPQSNNEFRFDQSIIGSNISDCLKKYMEFYKTVIDKPRAITVLLEEKIVPFSREQMSKLLYEEFPLQLSCFVACRIEADVIEHVSILEKAEEMGLAAVVESLLLNRPVYMLDKGQGILHPQVYKLLLKYKQPVCNLAVEPRGVTKIIEYFTEHTGVEGAQDVVSLLRKAHFS